MEKNQYTGRFAQAEVLPLRSLPGSNLDLRSEAPSLLTWEQAVRVLRKRRWLMVGVIGGLTSVFVAVALLMPNIYQPIARMQIDPPGGGISTLHEIEETRSEGDQDYLDTQVQILQSQGLAMRVIRALRLDKNSEFVNQNKPVSPMGSANNAASVAGPPQNEGSYLQEQLELANMTPAEGAALQRFHQKLLVNPVRGSRLVEVSFASHDPQLAQAVTNSLVTQFMDQNYRNRYVTTMQASDWLSSQLNDLRRKVAMSNQAVADYQKRYGLVESDERDVPFGQLMAEVSRQLSDAQADRIQAEASARMIDEGRVDAIPALRDDVVYQNLLTRYADVRSQLAQAQIIYGDENTNVKKLKGEAEELAAQIDAERDRLVKRVQAGFEASKAREQMMMQARERLRAEMGDASSHLVEYGMLKSEATANAGLYNTLEARLREAGIYAGLRSGNIRVVDMAPVLLNPTGPHRGLIVGLSLSFSVILAVFLAFLLESFDNTVRIPDDITTWVRLPSLAVLPSIARGKAKQNWLPASVAPSTAQLEENQRDDSIPMLFWSRTQTPEAEAILTLRNALLNSGLGPALKVILVSSPSAGEGKTTVALNLAGVLAQHGKTCLMEGDLRHPRIESVLNINPAAGLGEVLAGNLALNDALVPAQGIPGLAILPVRELTGSPADLLASEKMKSALATLREQFDHVVIDSPPMLSFSDARALATLSDAVILISRYGYTTRRAIARSAELLEGIQAPVLGVVLNDMDLSSPDYHYFNYGYSWAVSGRKYEQAYRKYVPAPAPQKNEAEKSRGAHA